MAHHVSFHLLEDTFPDVLVIVRDRLHERFHEIFRRLDAKNRKNGPLRLYPQGFLVRSWIYQIW